MIKDFIIVGQGIAGTILSHKLMTQGYSVSVIEHYKPNSASRIAAGVFNPVAYRKLKMAEFSDFLLPEVYSYYRAFEAELKTSFFSPSSFIKLLTDIEELNNWQIQSANKANSAFMSQEIFKDTFKDSIKNEYGGGQVLQSGVLHIPIMLDTWKEHLISNDSFIDESFDYSSLQIHENEVQYKTQQAKKIIFCEGVGAAKNPWFNWLPIQQFKGEVLEISAPRLKLNRMVNRGVFVLPTKNGTFKIGATHDWKHVDEIPTDEGKNELLEKLDKIINVPYKVVSHLAGLRPATRDRHPYIGAHPAHNNMYILNGLGSKGVIMMPWLANTFINGLTNNEWPKTFNINRFIRFYKEQNDEKN